MAVVAVTDDPNVAVVLSLHPALRPVEVLSTEDPDLDLEEAVAVVVDRKDHVPASLVRRLRRRFPELPIVVVGDTDDLFDVPAVYGIPRPLSTESLLKVLRRECGDDLRQQDDPGVLDRFRRLFRRGASEPAEPEPPSGPRGWTAFTR